MAPPREPFAGPETGPVPPFPLKLSGPVIKGFGRGSKELGIPTANIPISGLSIAGHSELESGVYFGYASLPIDPSTSAPYVPTSASTSASSDPPAATPSSTTNTSAPVPVPSTLPRKIYPMVMSLGFNPFYGNTVRSVEVHIISSFEKDFYGAELRLLMCGFVRPELDYVSKEALIEDIRTDIDVAVRSLERERWGVSKLGEGDGERWLKGEEGR